MKTKATRKLAITKGITRHIVGDEIRYTVDSLLGFQKLVGIATDWTSTEKFIWICKGFSA